MLELLLEPFNYDFMAKAILVSIMVGGVCAFLSAYLMLKHWSLVGDALSHSVVPGVAIAYALHIPFAIGAFFSGFLAALAILWVKSITRLREDAVIGFIFTSFFALGLFIISLNPTSVNVQNIIFGNILGIAKEDIWQIAIISIVSFIVLFFNWRDLLLALFDDIHASSVGLNPVRLKVIFFTLLSASVVAALQTVGAILVIAMLITPGATAYLISDRFGVIAFLATIMGVVTSGVGAYLSYFFNAPPGALIVVFQGILFTLAFLFAPKYGLWGKKKRGILKEQKGDSSAL